MEEIEAERNALSREVLGAAIEVHRVLGPGFLERIYEQALERELTLRGIYCQCQFPIAVSYKGIAVGEGRIDLMVENCLPIELKAVDGLLPIHSAQLLSYLKALSMPLGLLINFNVSDVEVGYQACYPNGKCRSKCGRY
jgi:GxxExxY protein